MVDLQNGIDMNLVSNPPTAGHLQMLTWGLQLEVHGSLHVSTFTANDAAHANIFQGCPQFLYITKGCQ